MNQQGFEHQIVTATSINPTVRQFVLSYLITTPGVEFVQVLPGCELQLCVQFNPVVVESAKAAVCQASAECLLHLDAFEEELHKAT